jgi:hypothetical protein
MLFFWQEKQIPPKCSLNFSIPNQALILNQYNPERSSCTRDSREQSDICWTLATLNAPGCQHGICGTMPDSHYNGE